MRTNKSVGLNAKILFKESPPPLTFWMRCAKSEIHTHKNKKQNKTHTKNLYRVMAREEMTLTRKTTIVLYQTSAIKKNHRPLFTGFYVIYGAFGHGWCKQGYFWSQKQRVDPTTLTQHFNIKSRSNLLIDHDSNTQRIFVTKSRQMNLTSVKILDSFLMYVYWITDSSLLASLLHDLCW